MHTPGAGFSLIKLVLALVLIGGLAALTMWIVDVNARPPVYGYVGVEPVHRFDPLHPAANEVVDWSGLAVEQHTQATMLMSNTLMQSVMQRTHLGIRDTRWFKSQ